MKKLFALFLILWGSSSFAWYWLEGYKAELVGDYKRAFMFYKKSCELDHDPLACISVGVFYAKGIGAEKSYIKSTPYLLQGCRALIKAFDKKK